MPKGDTSRPATTLDKRLPGFAKTGDLTREMGAAAEKAAIARGKGKDFVPYRRGAAATPAPMLDELYPQSKGRKKGPNPQKLPRVPRQPKSY